MYLPFFNGPTAPRACNLSLLPPVEARSPPNLRCWEDKTNGLSIYNIRPFAPGKQIIRAANRQTARASLKSEVLDFKGDNTDLSG